MACHTDASKNLTQRFAQLLQSKSKGGALVTSFGIADDRLWSPMDFSHLWDAWLMLETS